MCIIFGIDDLQEKLDTTATRLQRSKGWIINDALRQYIEREERKEVIMFFDICALRR